MLEIPIIMQNNCKPNSWRTIITLALELYDFYKVNKVIKKTYSDIPYKENKLVKTWFLSLDPFSLLCFT